jgi:hypothetical protein
MDKVQEPSNCDFWTYIDKNISFSYEEFILEVLFGVSETWLLPVRRHGGL